MTDPPSTIKRLRERLAVGTKRPWSEGLWFMGRPEPVVSLNHPVTANDRQLIIDAVNSLPALLDALEAAQRENARLIEGGAHPFDRRAADILADEVAVLVRRRVIDARSPAGDALLDYRDPPPTDRSDRLAQVEADRDRLQAEVERLRGGRLFPIMRDRNDQCPRSVPWSVLAAHEAQAKDNHDQTLARLAERGGLSPQEAWCVAHDRRWRERCSEADAAAWVVSVQEDVAADRDRWKERAEAAERWNAGGVDKVCEEYKTRAEAAERERDSVRDAARTIDADCDQTRIDLAAAQRRIEALEKVAAFAEHGWDCDHETVTPIGAQDCNCGLDAALQAAKEAGK